MIDKPLGFAAPSTFRDSRPTTRYSATSIILAIVLIVVVDRYGSALDPSDDHLSLFVNLQLMNAPALFLAMYLRRVTDNERRIYSFLGFAGLLVSILLYVIEKPYTWLSAYDDERVLFAFTWSTLTIFVSIIGGVGIERLRVPIYRGYGDNGPRRRAVSLAIASLDQLTRLRDEVLTAADVGRVSRLLSKLANVLEGDLRRSYGGFSGGESRALSLHLNAAANEVRAMRAELAISDSATLHSIRLRLASALIGLLLGNLRYLPLAELRNRWTYGQVLRRITISVLPTAVFAPLFALVNPLPSWVVGSGAVFSTLWFVAAALPLVDDDAWSTLERFATVRSTLTVDASK